MKPKFIKGEDCNEEDILLDINGISYMYPPEDNQDSTLIFLKGSNEEFFISVKTYNKLKEDYALTIK